MKTQYYAATSLDGFIAGPNDDLDWLMQFGAGEPGEETSYPAFIREVGALAMGSATYEWMLRHHIRPAAGEPKQPLTASTVDSTFAVSWFPDDGRALYTADRGGNEINHVFVRELDGSARELTPGDKAKADFVGWSGDRKWFYIATNERDA